MTSTIPTSVRLPEDARKELELLTAEVGIKQLELNNVQLRRELAMLRAVAALGLYGHKVTLDLDSGVVIVEPAREGAE